jgi:hypothetical protein
MLVAEWIARGRQSSTAAAGQVVPSVTMLPMMEGSTPSLKTVGWDG